MAWIVRHKATASVEAAQVNLRVQRDSDGVRAAVRGCYTDDGGRTTAVATTPCRSLRGSASAVT